MVMILEINTTFSNVMLLHYCKYDAGGGGVGEGLGKGFGGMGRGDGRRLIGGVGRCCRQEVWVRSDGMVRRKVGEG